MDKVSIVVPVYNVEKYISTCINSLLQQDYENIEIILIDDGSQDHSSSICDTYARKDTRIRVYHKKILGSVLHGILELSVQLESILCLWIQTIQSKEIPYQII